MHRTNICNYTNCLLLFLLAPMLTPKFIVYLSLQTVSSFTNITLLIVLLYTLNCHKQIEFLSPFTMVLYLHCFIFFPAEGRDLLLEVA